jgi:hypothetical protein
MDTLSNVYASSSLYSHPIWEKYAIAFKIECYKNT